MGETVSLVFDLNGSMERVWHALTDAATLSRWTMFETDDFRPVVGHRFRFRGKADSGWTGSVDCEVLEVDEPRRLSYTWVGGPQGLVIHTTLVWTLTEVEPGVTRLRLEQSGFQPAAKQAIGGARYGWTHMLGQLQALLASA